MTDGQRADCNIPIAFLKNAGIKKVAESGDILLFTLIFFHLKRGN